MDRLIDALLDEAIERHQAGDFQSARPLYEQVLQRDARNADALNLLGLLAHQQGQHQEAIDRLQQAIAIDDSAAEFYLHLGEACRAMDDLPSAMAAFQKSVALDASLPAAWRRLADTLYHARDYAAAADAWERAIGIEPGDAASYNNYGLALRGTHRHEAAAAAFEKALSLDAKLPQALENPARCLVAVGLSPSDAAERMAYATPGRAESFSLLAAILIRDGDYASAVEAAEKAIARDAGHVDGWFTLGRAKDYLADYKGAADAYRQALALQPESKVIRHYLALAQRSGGDLKKAGEVLRELAEESPDTYESWAHLATTLHLLNDFPGGIEAAEKALSLRPDDGDMLNLLATICTRAGMHSRAVELYERGLQQNPVFPPTYSNYASLLALQGNVATAVKLYREALQKYPRDRLTRSNYLLYLNGLPGESPETIAREHRHWEPNLVPLKVPPFKRDTTSGKGSRKLRIGYISPDFRSHSVAYFIGPILACHDHEKFHVTVYDDVKSPDEITAVLRKFADRWERVLGRSNERLVEQVRGDEIDILVDLTGHTADNRLPAFAARMAPIQVNYLGYPNTTGIAAMDYRITDADVDPPGEPDAWHTEKLIRLQRCFLAYHSTGKVPDVAALPAVRNGYVTFGSFNALSKVSPELIALWARAMQAVPNSRMVLKGTGFDDPGTRARFIRLFGEAGIAEDRLELIARTKFYHQHLELYSKVDIGLDTYPYAGTTTTCEAMYMGVPVITKVGPNHVSRVGLTVVNGSSLPELATFDDDAFVAKARAMAADIPKLAALRANLRPRMLRSPICDAVGLTRAIEQAFRRIWTKRGDAARSV